MPRLHYLGYLTCNYSFLSAHHLSESGSNKVQSQITGLKTVTAQSHITCLKTVRAWSQIIWLRKSYSTITNHLFGNSYSTITNHLFGNSYSTITQIIVLEIVTAHFKITGNKSEITVIILTKCIGLYIVNYTITYLICISNFLKHLCKLFLFL